MLKPYTDEQSKMNSRWHVAQKEFLDALAGAMKSPAVFLKTKGDKHRENLCMVALGLAGCCGWSLDVKGMTARSKAAIQANPTYSNPYAKLAPAFAYQHQYQEALES
jgi:hypothetical protein